MRFGTVVAAVVALSGAEVLAQPPSPRGVAERIGGLSGRPFGVTLSPQGEVFVTRQDANAVSRLGPDLSNRDHAVSVGSNPVQIAFDRSGRLAYVTHVLEPSVAVVDVRANRMVARVPVGGSAWRVLVTPDGARALVTTDRGDVEVVDTHRRVVTSQIAVGHGVNGIALAPSGQAALVSAIDGQVALVSLTEHAVARRRRLGGFPQEVLLAPGACEAYVANESGWVDVIEPRTLEHLGRIPMPAGAFGLGLMPYSGRLLVTSPGAGQVFVVDLEKRAVVETVEVGGMPRRVLVMPDGTTALVANEGGWVDVLR